MSNNTGIYRGFYNTLRPELALAIRSYVFQSKYELCPARKLTAEEKLQRNAERERFRELINKSAPSRFALMSSSRLATIINNIRFNMQRKGYDAKYFSIHDQFVASSSSAQTLHDQAGASSNSSRTNINCNVEDHNNIDNLLINKADTNKSKF